MSPRDPMVLQMHRWALRAARRGLCLAGVAAGVLGGLLLLRARHAAPGAAR